MTAKDTIDEKAESNDVGDMRIGEAAQATGLTVKAIRHYEAVDLLPRVERAGAYRDFSAADIRHLKTIAHCRSLGFSVDEIREILALVVEARPDCPNPEEMALVIEAKLTAIRAEVAALERRAQQLEKAKQYVDSRRSDGSNRA